jgi:integrase
MRVEDLQSKGTGWLIRLHEKGGKQHMMPCHHALADALHAYIAAAGIAADKKPRTSRGHGGTALADQPMTQVDAWRMVRKRALAAGIMAPIRDHSFGATGITAYLANAARWNMRRRWPRRRVLARQSSMIARKSDSRSTRSRG